MTLFDYAALGVIALSVAIGVFRGATREVIAIASWTVSGYLALSFAPALATLLPGSFSSPTLRLGTAFAAILLSCLLVFALLSLAMGALLKRSGLTGADRALGAVVGLARAVVILVVLTLLAGLTTLPREPSWRNARSSDMLESLAILVRGYLPSALAARIRYD
jgi:membrane protein required for colicin V production